LVLRDEAAAFKFEQKRQIFSRFSKRLLQQERQHSSEIDNGCDNHSGATALDRRWIVAEMKVQVAAKLTALLVGAVSLWHFGILMTTTTTTTTTQGELCA
jgi:hypothetical protein